MFTLKNPHGVEPTRFMKRKGSRYAIYCDSGCGPVFGDGWGFDICIKGNFYKGPFHIPRMYMKCIELIDYFNL